MIPTRDPEFSVALRPTGWIVVRTDTPDGAPTRAYGPFPDEHTAVAAVGHLGDAFGTSGTYLTAVPLHAATPTHPAKPTHRGATSGAATV